MLDKTATAWSQKPLSDVADLNPRLDKSAYRDDLEVSFVPMAAVEAGSGRMEVSQAKRFAAVKKGYTPFKEGDVLFAKITPCMENGKMVVVPKLTNGIGFGSTEFHVLRPHEGVDPRYVYHFVSSQNFRREAAHRMTGAVGQKRVPQSFLEEALIPVPLFDDQQRIVAEIEKQFSRLDEAVASLKRTKANLKRYKASVLKAAVEGKLTEDWRKAHPDAEPESKLLERILAERRTKWNGRGKYREPDFVDAVSLPLLPNTWEWASLDQLLLNITDGDHQPPPQTDSGVPFLVIGNVRSGKIEFGETRFVSREYADAVDIFRKPTRGDILYTLVGSFGIALRVDTNQEFCIQRHIGVLRPHKLSPTSYLVHVLNSLFIFTQAANVATGTAQKTVPLAGLRRFAIPLAPLAEQQQIIAEVERRLSVIEELETSVNANLTRADRLRQSILSQAFSGRLVGRNTRPIPDSLPPVSLAAESHADYGKDNRARR